MWQLVTARIYCWVAFVTTALGTSGILQRFLWLRVDIILYGIFILLVLHPLVCIVYLFSKKKDMDITFMLVIMTLLWLLGILMLASIEAPRFG